MKTYLLSLLLLAWVSLSAATARDTDPPQPHVALKRRVMLSLLDDLKKQYGAQAVRVSTTHGRLLPHTLLADPKDDKKDGQNSESAKKAKELFEKLQKDKKDLPDFRTDMAVEFPLLLNLVTEGNKQVALCFNDVKVYPGYSEISLFLKIRISDYTFFFGGDKLKYRENGDGGFFESGRLVLLGDATYKTKNYSFMLKGGEIKDNGSFGDATSVLYNCGKLENLKLGGEVWLNPEVFIPIDKKGKPLKDSTERVKSKLDVTIDLSNKFKKLDELIVTLGFSPFALKEYKDKVGFNVESITLDLSESATPDGALKALEKVDTLFNAKGDKGKKGKAWKGLYIDKAEVYLPEDLSGKDKGEGTDKKEDKKDDKKTDKPLRSFKASNIIIGDVGLTASLGGFNVIRLNDERPISKWDMSVDTVQIDFVNSVCKKFNIKGQVNIPQEEADCGDKKEGDAKTADVSKPDKSKAMLLNYAGLVSISDKENAYSLGVRFAAERKFGFLGGQATLKPNSAVELKLSKKTGKSAQFEAKATLNGEWSFAIKTDKATTKDMDKPTAGCPTTDDKDKTLGMREVKFTDCEFMTSSPYFKIGSFAYSDTNSKLSTFPIFIEKLEVKTLAEKKDEKKDDKKDDKKDAKVADAKKDDKVPQNQELQLAIDVKFRVSLADNALSGKGDVGLLFDYGDRNDKFYFKYNSLSIKEVAVKADFSAFKLDGGLKVMKKDPDYGDGFMGRINLSLGKDQTTQIKMNGIYGNLAPVGRYFYLDGSYANTNAPLKKFEPKNLQINGAAVGLAIKMVPTKEKSEFSVFNKKFVPTAGRYSLIAGMPYGNILPKAGDTFDGNALLTVNFGGSYGIASVLAYGDIRVKTKTIEPLTDGDLKKSFASAGDKLGADKAVTSLADGKAKAKEADGKKDPKSGAFVANVGIDLNLEKGGLFIDGEAFLDMGALRGAYDKNKMGDVTMYAGKEGFYAWLGTPTKPLAAQLDITSSATLRGEAYLNLGKLPPADQLVRTYPPGLISQLDMANKKAVEKGYPKYELFRVEDATARMGARNGMLVGASLNLGDQEYRYDPFFARVGGGVGLDIVVASYNNAACESGARIDGVYGSGQFYLYANVAAGVEIPKWKWFGPWRFDLGDLNGLLVGKAGIPAPFYLDGLLYGKYVKKLRLLGYERTLIDKEFVFNVRKGTPCEPRSVPTAEQKASDLAEGIIWPGHEFKREEKIFAKNKRFYLVFQKDGNLVSYLASGKPVWATGTNDKRVTRMAYQNDGNVVAYEGNRPIWASNTSNRDGQALIQQADGNLVIYNTREEVVWASGVAGYRFPTDEARAEEQRRGIISPPYSFSVGHDIKARGMWGLPGSVLTFEKSGNLIVYSEDKSRVIWSSNTDRLGVTHCEFEEDGKLVFWHINKDDERRRFVVTESGTSGRARRMEFNSLGLIFFDKNNAYFQAPYLPSKEPKRE